MTAAARRLQHALLLKDVRRWTARAAAVIGLICIGWYAHWQAGAFNASDNDDTPAFVVDAVHAYRTHLLRAQARMNVTSRITVRLRDCPGRAPLTGLARSATFGVECPKTRFTIPSASRR